MVDGGRFPVREIEQAIRALVDSLPGGVVRGLGLNEEESAHLRSLRLPNGLESVMLHDWPRIVEVPRRMASWNRAAEELRWQVDPDVRHLGPWYAREIQMLEVGSCLNGDIVAVDHSEESCPVYVIEMATLVDSDRPADQPFCIRLADSLLEFVEWAATAGSWERGSMGVLDFYSLIDLSDNRFSPPESRPAARRIHPDSQ